jgi:hypothetical protein
LLTSSSRRHPCPVCGRQKNSSCRWGEKVIYCFCGDDHHPPMEMRTGETLQINGNEWALVATDGGHSGNSFVFRPHSGPPRPPLPRAKRRKQQNTAQLLLREVMADVDAALAVPEFMHSPPDELRSSFELIDRAAHKADLLKPALQSMPDPKGHRQLLDDAVKELRYQQADANHFRKHYLGEVQP